MKSTSKNIASCDYKIASCDYKIASCDYKSFRFSSNEIEAIEEIEDIEAIEDIEEIEDVPMMSPRCPQNIIAIVIEWINGLSENLKKWHADLYTIIAHYHYKSSCWS